MIKASDLAKAGCRYLGTPYSVLDCQAFVEKAMAACGLHKNLPGSNAWYRQMTWVGTPEECVQRYGGIPPGAFLYILKPTGEPEKYKKDGIGNASHIGIYTGMTGKEMVQIGLDSGDQIAGGYNYGDGAIHSSSSRGAVCTSKFEGKTINGGWNRIGLWETEIDYGGGGMEVTYQARVVGGALNMRAKPDKSSDRICQIPDGSIVTVTEDLAGWSKVVYNSNTGYVMTMYLEEITQESDTVSVRRDDLQKMYDQIGDWLGLRG